MLNRTQRKVRRQYRQINNAKAELQFIRIMCEHENLERVNYEWRVGQITEGQLVCADCGEVIHDEENRSNHLKLNVNTKEK
jgi:hypothetical protein